MPVNPGPVFSQLDQLMGTISGSTWDLQNVFSPTGFMASVSHGAPHDFSEGKNKTSKRQAGTPTLLGVATKVDIHLQKKAMLHSSQ